MQTNNITLFELSMVTKLKTFLDIDFTTYQIVNEKDRKKGTFNDLRFCTKIATSLTQHNYTYRCAYKGKAINGLLRQYNN